MPSGLQSRRWGVKGGEGKLSSVRSPPGDRGARESSRTPVLCSLTLAFVYSSRCSRRYVLSC